MLRIAASRVTLAFVCVCVCTQVKIADFGVARMIETSGHMTAETGTYRWMAPEVIEHKPYDEKADVFSFGVVMWELLTCKVSTVHSSRQAAGGSTLDTHTTTAGTDTLGQIVLNVCVYVPVFVMSAKWSG